MKILKFVCIAKGIGRMLTSELKLIGKSDFIPISGCDGQELKDGSIVCSTCGKVIFDAPTRTP